MGAWTRPSYSDSAQQEAKMKTDNDGNPAASNESGAGEMARYAQRLLNASKEIVKVIDLDRVRYDAELLYGACTTGASRAIPMAIQIQSRDEIIAVLRIANDHGVAVYPISTGKNWGYGTSNPVENFCVLLDLSRMNRILDFDGDLATVQVEPGVTQQQLKEFMDKRGLEFLVPATGAGPHASLLGNLLERGFGITPHADHFAALLALEAVLPSGEIYRSTLSDAGCDQANQNFKWGLGPYLDGLFAQGNFGIVTHATIALMRRPDACEALIFTVNSDADLPRATEALRKITQALPGIVGGMNLMNNRRMLAMTAPYPKSHVHAGQILTNEQLSNLQRAHHIGSWTGIGGIYGTKGVVRAAKKEIRKILEPFARKITFVSPRTVQTVGLLARILPLDLGGSKAISLKNRLTRLMDVVQGNPTEAALPLAYWRSEKSYVPGQSHNLAKDDCGLIWYSPLVVNKPRVVQSYVAFVTKVCAEFGIEPLLTLTTISERCFDSTVPLLFNRKNKEEMSRAQACYQTLLVEGQKLGFFPYRLGIDQMKQVTNQPDSISWRMVAKLKSAIDPHQILSPGRYSPVPDQVPYQNETSRVPQTPASGISRTLKGGRID